MNFIQRCTLKLVSKVFLKYANLKKNLQKMYLECNYGTYGKDCRYECGSCINQTHCHYVNGSCLEGCDPGYMGDICDKGNIHPRIY